MFGKISHGDTPQMLPTLHHMGLYNSSLNNHQSKPNLPWDRDGKPRVQLRWNSQLSKLTY